MTYREAVREGICEALHRDPRVFLMGEDVGHYGGCFAVSRGLLEEFGPERIRDTPLSESGFVGAGIGAALGGMRPIVEIMTCNFSLLALDQIMNTAATLLHMSGGQFNVPLVIRMATGGGKQLAAQHSHSLEGWYAHIPGIKVLTPATLEDGAACWPRRWRRSRPGAHLRKPDALQHGRASLPANAGPVDMATARSAARGRDVSILTYGASLQKSLEAATTLAQRRHRRRGHRPARAAPARRRDHHGQRGEDAPRAHRGRRLAQRRHLRGDQRAHHGAGVLRTRSPVERLCTAEVPIPYAKHLEEAALPQVGTIVAPARDW